MEVLKTMKRKCLGTLLSVLAAAMMLAANIGAQTLGTHPDIGRQVAAPLPKLALNGAVGETRAGVQYHRIVLMITNWEKYPDQMFSTALGRRLSGGCSDLKTRVVISVHSERGDSVSACIPALRPVDLGKFSILVQKGKSIPDFVYVVIHDRYTDAAYRSNLVSPWTGMTK